MPVLDRRAEEKRPARPTRLIPCGHRVWAAAGQLVALQTVTVVACTLRSGLSSSRYYLWDEEQGAMVRIPPR
jgi:hypothetical protein